MSIAVNLFFPSETKFFFSTCRASSPFQSISSNAFLFHLSCFLPYQEHSGIAIFLVLNQFLHIPQYFLSRIGWIILTFPFWLSQDFKFIILWLIMFVVFHYVQLIYCVYNGILLLNLLPQFHNLHSYFIPLFC